MKPVADLLKRVRPQEEYVYICARCGAEVKLRQKEDILPDGWVELATFDLVCEGCSR